MDGPRGKVAAWGVVMTCLMLCAACRGELSSNQGASPGDGASTDDGAGMIPSEMGSPDGGSGEADMMGSMAGQDMSLEEMMGAGEESFAEGNEILPAQQADLFTCASGEALPSPARLRLVDREEWKKNVSRNTNAAGLSPFDPLAQHDYSTYVEGETINAEVLDVYINMSSVAASAWKGPGDWERSLRWSSPFKSNPMLVANVSKVGCLVDERKSPPDDACLDEFVKLLLEKAVLYRPASSEEVNALKQYAVKSLAKESATPTRTERSNTVRKIIQAAWMMSGALFRQEGFASAPDAEGISALDDWEIAHALAYALARRAPGAVVEGSDEVAGTMPELVIAARDGVLRQPEQIEAIIDQYATRDDATWARRSVYLASDGIQNFFREWLGYMSYLEGSKDSPHATTAYSKDVIDDTYHFAVNGPRHSGSSYEPQLFHQLDDLIARVLHEDEDVLEKLLTTREYYVAADVGKDGGSPHFLYNLDTSTEATQEGRWVTVPANQRAGVLTHPAWLASHSLNFENDPNPVHRGKWVREYLLCEDVPPTPVTVEAALDPETKDLSTRERVKLKTEQPQCTSCHDLMNPLGYPFEIYNHIGILRADDHGNAPDGSSVLIKMPDPALDGPVRDAVEMSEKLAQSNYVKRCFIRQSFRYFMGRPETMQDACILTQMEQAYDERGSFKQMLKVLFTSRTFLERQHPELKPE